MAQVHAGLWRSGPLSSRLGQLDRKRKVHENHCPSFGKAPLLVLCAMDFAPELLAPPPQAKPVKNPKFLSNLKMLQSGTWDKASNRWLQETGTYWDCGFDMAGKRG